MGQTVGGQAMNFDSLAAFFYMGGHGLFIWSAYGVTFIVLAVNVLLPRMTRAKFIQSEKNVQRREAARGTQ